MPAFDTLKATKLLKASGFEETQAEAVVATVRDAIAENVATKADVTEAGNELKLEIAGVRAELKDDIAKVQIEIKDDIEKVSKEISDLRTVMYRFGAFMIATTVGLVVTLMKALP